MSSQDDLQAKVGEVNPSVSASNLNPTMLVELSASGMSRLDVTIQHLEIVNDA